MSRPWLKSRNGPYMLGGGSPAPGVLRTGYFDGINDINYTLSPTYAVPATGPLSLAALVFGHVNSNPLLVRVYVDTNNWIGLHWESSYHCRGLVGVGGVYYHSGYASRGRTLATWAWLCIERDAALKWSAHIRQAGDASWVSSAKGAAQPAMPALSRIDVGGTAFTSGNVAGAVIVNRGLFTSGEMQTWYDDPSSPDKVPQLGVDDGVRYTMQGTYPLCDDSGPNGDHLLVTGRIDEATAYTPGYPPDPAGTP